MDRTAFLHASDIFDPRHADTGQSEPPHNENFRSLVAEGNEILVQVVKDPWGPKARDSRRTLLASRYHGVDAERAAAWAYRHASRTKLSASA